MDHKQRETLKLKVGETAFCVNWSGEISKVRIVGDCNEGHGYMADFVSADPKFQLDPEYPHRIHTCNLYLAATLADARREALRVNKNQLERWKKSLREAKAAVKYLEYAVRNPHKVEVN